MNYFTAGDARASSSESPFDTPDRLRHLGVAFRGLNLRSSQTAAYLRWLNTDHPADAVPEGLEEQVKWMFDHAESFSPNGSPVLSEENDWLLRIAGERCLARREQDRVRAHFMKQSQGRTRITRAEARAGVESYEADRRRGMERRRVALRAWYRERSAPSAGPSILNGALPRAREGHGSKTVSHQGSRRQANKASPGADEPPGKAAPPLGRSDLRHISQATRPLLRGWLDRFNRTAARAGLEPDERLELFLAHPADEQADHFA